MKTQMSVMSPHPKSHITHTHYTYMIKYIFNKFYSVSPQKPNYSLLDIIIIKKNISKIYRVDTHKNILVK